MKELKDKRQGLATKSLDEIADEAAEVSNCIQRVYDFEFLRRQTNAIIKAAQYAMWAVIVAAVSVVATVGIAVLLK
jgi:hypothetical protein